ncbi:MAG: nucleotide exchange factor GrpE [Gammaproteobacteria bacterium]|nr:nucleotide exchange factor GrpE [Gammaproteobacteria bacterium]MBU1558233.1 nucleotide exchange factor GrpE [Gammaproteobacteria bacterium]
MKNRQSSDQKIHSSLFDHNDPVKDPHSKLKQGDPDLDKKLEQEIQDIEDLEQEACVANPDQCSICDVKSEVETLKKTLEESHEKLLRAYAEMENVRHRASVDVEKARQFSLERFVKELIPVVDNLENALLAVPAEQNEWAMALMKGVKLTMQMFLDVLTKFGVVQINPEGKAFDPQFHEAMAMQESAKLSPNTVLQVFQKGYTLNGRLIRAARVVVVKG